MDTRISPPIVWMLDRLKGMPEPGSWWREDYARYLGRAMRPAEAHALSYLSEGVFNRTQTLRCLIGL